MQNFAKYAKYAKLWKMCKFVQNVKILWKMCNTCKCAKLWKMCKIVEYLKKKSAKYIKLCINVNNVPNCVRCAKFGKMYRIVQKLCKLENMCKIVQHVQGSFFMKVQNCAKFSKSVKMLTIEEILQTPQNDVIRVTWVTRLRGFLLPVVWYYYWQNNLSRF